MVKNFTALLLMFAMAFTVFFVPEQALAKDSAYASFQNEYIKGYSGIVRKLSTKNRLYISVSKGGKNKTRTVKIYKSSKSGKKGAYIASVNVKTNKKGFGRATWKGASKNTYYRLWVKGGVSQGSYVGLTSK